ncbi:MAG: hypothetical protein Q8N81_05365, partial [bacterium]|nr:hypothetical protein [bacterium]
MIDIPKEPEKIGSDRKSFRVRLIAVIILALLLISAAWTAWIFLKPSRTVTLSEGQSYRFHDYQVTIEKITMSFCPSGEDQNCTEWLKEKGVQLRYIAPHAPGIGFEYLGMSSKTSFELADIKVILVSVDANKKSAKLTLV